MGNHFGGDSDDDHKNNPLPNHQTGQRPPQHIPGRPTPNYIRNITVENKSNHVITVDTKHKS